MSKYDNANRHVLYPCNHGTVASSLSGALLLRRIPGSMHAHPRSLLRRQRLHLSQ